MDPSDSSSKRRTSLKRGIYCSFIVISSGFLMGFSACRSRQTHDMSMLESASWLPLTKVRDFDEQTYVDEDGHDEIYWINKLVEQSDATVAKLKESTGIGRRSAHAKHHGCVTGTFTPSTVRSSQTKVGLFSSEKSSPVWIRFSNAIPAMQSDLIPDARGMAIKIIGNTSPKLLPGHESSNAIDFPLVSGPIFPVANVKEYFELQENLPKFLANHLEAASRVTEIARKSVMKSPLYGTYWSMGAYKLGAKAVKYKVWPCESSWFNVPVTADGNFLRMSMIRQLETEKKEACFNFGVQFQLDRRTMPVEDPAREWRESDSFFSSAKRLVVGGDPVSEFQLLGKIRIPAQEFQSNDEFCERLSFNPWRTIPEQRPLGNLMRARLAVYAASLGKRNSLNGAREVQDYLTGTKSDVAAAPR